MRCLTRPFSSGRISFIAPYLFVDPSRLVSPPWEYPALLGRLLPRGDRICRRALMAKILVAPDAWTMLRLTNLPLFGLVAWMACFTTPLAIGGEPPKGNNKPTFTKDVAPILQKKCQNCHRSHHIGPFALE